MSRLVVGARRNFVKVIFSALVQVIKRREDRFAVIGSQKTISHSADLQRMMIVLAGTEAVGAIPVSRIIPQSWSSFHIAEAILVIEIIAVVSFLGIAAALRTCPHVVHGEILTLRTGFGGDVEVPLSVISRAFPAERTVSRSGIRIDSEDGSFAYSAGTQTTLVIELQHPCVIDIKGKTETVQRIRCQADEPTTSARLINESLLRNC